MGLADAFTPEVKTELKFSEFYNLTKEAAKAQLMLNAVNCDVPHEYIRETMTGKKEDPAVLPEINISADYEIESIFTSIRLFLRMMPDEKRVSQAVNTLRDIVETAKRERLNEIIVDNSEKLKAMDTILIRETGTLGEERCETCFHYRKGKQIPICGLCEDGSKYVKDANEQQGQEPNEGDQEESEEK